MRIRFIFVMLFLSTAARLEAKPQNLQVVHGPTFEGVILTPELMRRSRDLYNDTNQYWLPSADKVLEAERLLPAAIAQKIKVPKHFGPNLPRYFSAKNGTNLNFSKDPPNLAQDYEYADDFLYDMAPDLAKYKRQYVGEFIKGKKVLLMSFIYDPDSFHDPNGIGQWHHKWIYVLDGGYSFWRVLFNPTTGTFSDWECNGDG